MELTGKAGRNVGKPAWAPRIVLAAVVVLLGLSLGGFLRHPRAGGAREPRLQVTEVRFDGASGNTVLRLMVTNGTSRDWEFLGRIPNSGAAPIPDLFRFDTTGNGGTMSRLSDPTNQSMPVKRFRLGAGQSVPLEFSAPLDPTVRTVAILADEHMASDRLRALVNRLMKRVGMPFQISTQPMQHILEAEVPMNPLTPILLQ